MRLLALVVVMGVVVATCSSTGAAPSALSTGGRYVAFESGKNLLPGETNDAIDVFVRDRVAGTTEGLGVVHNSRSFRTELSSEPSLSADGRYVAFESGASDLVPGDTNGFQDVFVRDRKLGRIERASVSSDGTQGNGSSIHPSLSADGRYVAFESLASNLVPGDTNDDWDVFVRDRVRGTTERVSVDSDGRQGDAANDASSSLPVSLSADGRFVAFESRAPNLVPGDTNGRTDVFVRDRVQRTTERISVDGNGTQGDSLSREPSVSADGRYVAFASSASNLTPVETTYFEDVFVRDRARDATELVSVSSDGAPGNSVSHHPSLSADGRYVAFESWASNLVPGDTNDLMDVFVRDRVAGTTERVSVSSDGLAGNGSSTFPAISADGRYVAFHSAASNLVLGDIHDGTFIRDRVTGTTELISVATTPARAGKLVLKPEPLHEGRQLIASMSITQGSKPVIRARVVCAATVAWKSLRVASRRYRNGVARCVWTLPRASAGQMFRGRISAMTPNGPVTRRVQARIA